MSGWPRWVCRPTSSSASSTRAPTRRSDPPRIDFLRVEPGSERYAGAIDALFSDQVGRIADPTQLGKRVNELYGQGNLEIFDYRVVQGDALPSTTRTTAWR